MSKQNFLERFHNFHENRVKHHFGRWGHFVGTRPCLTFCCSFIMLVLFVSGLAYSETYPDVPISWVPQNGWSLESREKSTEAFSAGFTAMQFIVRSRAGNILTLDQFNEILSLTNTIYNTEYTDDDGNTYTYKDFCFKNMYGYCVPRQHPLAFFETYSSSMYDLSALTTDAQVLTAVQAGRVMRTSALAVPVQISPLFGETTPSTVTQDLTTGANDLTAAVATRLIFNARTTSDSELANWNRVQAEIFEAIGDFNDASTLIEVGMFSPFANTYAVRRNIIRSLPAVLVSLLLVVVYSIAVLSGGCGPVRCRCNAGWLGLLTIIVSLLAGFGLGSAVADRIQFLPFSILLLYVLIALGCTYMYLISRTID